MIKLRWIVAAMSLVVVPLGSFGLELAPVFTDNAVLQRGKPVCIWGSSDSGSNVSVSYAGQEKTVKADGDGKWMVRLDPMQASSESRDLLVTSGELTLLRRDVVVGEVWIAGGQSNMEFALRNATGGAELIPTIDNPSVRFYTVPRWQGFEATRPRAATWTKAKGKDASYFSAVAYYYAADLQERLGVPVGVVSCSLGASTCEAWMSEEQLRKEPSLAYLADQFDALLPQYDAAAVRAHAKQIQQWHASDHNTRGPWPVSPPNPYSRKVGTALYRSMLSTIIPFTVRGAIWYQGEGNAISKRGYEYRTLFPALIQSWREDFECPDMPFYFVQLAPFEGFGDKGGSVWADLREAQLLTWQNLPSTGMAVAADVGEEKDIHPKNKQPLGERLARFARRDCYGEEGVLVSGPIYRSASVEGAIIRVAFDHVGQGLELKGELGGFEICGADQLFRPASVRIEGDCVVVSSSEVEAPTAVRYAWKNWFVASLFNKDGLPASPFRTDNFKLQTQGN